MGWRMCVTSSCSKHCVSSAEQRRKVIFNKIFNIFFLLLFFITFTEQFKLYGKSQKTIDETLRICRDKNVLSEYLKHEEVATIMYKFMDQETAMKKALRTERQEGRQEGILDTLIELVKDGILTVADASRRAGLTQDEFLSRSAASGGKP